MDTRFIATAGKCKGKVVKLRLLQSVIQEESRNGRKPDKKRTMLLAQKKLEQYSPEQREGITLTSGDYDQAMLRFRKNPAEIMPAENNGKTPAPAKEAAPPRQESFSKEELLAASKFLRFCGSSLSRAKQLLDFIYVLTREQT